MTTTAISSIRVKPRKRGCAEPRTFDETMMPIMKSVTPCVPPRAAPPIAPRRPFVAAGLRTPDQQGAQGAPAVAGEQVRTLPKMLTTWCTERPLAGTVQTVPVGDVVPLV